MLFWNVGFGTKEIQSHYKAVEKAVFPVIMAAYPKALDLISPEN